MLIKKAEKLASVMPPPLFHIVIHCPSLPLYLPKFKISTSPHPGSSSFFPLIENHLDSYSMLYVPSAVMHALLYGRI